MPADCTETHSFTDQLYEGMQHDYTKRLVNKIMTQILHVYKDDFFMLHLYVLKTGKKTFSCQLSVEAYQGETLLPVEIGNDSAQYISTLCTILHAYNGYYADIFQWNTMTITLHFEGRYKIHRAFDTALEKQHGCRNSKILSNIVQLKNSRSLTASKTNGSPL
ncbi:hypothetical protein [Agarilytica rhodophyticola]|uniref:hypothetical protein n=1 Tax=Agarilytica rhodophyticola TaxID=1737490 RepID=UPI000B344ECD|nr:hypothetical protein [Agarilytica rhodophyticola]